MTTTTEVRVWARSQICVCSIITINLWFQHTYWKRLIPNQFSILYMCSLINIVQILILMSACPDTFALQTRVCLRLHLCDWGAGINVTYRLCTHYIDDLYHIMHHQKYSYCSLVPRPLPNVGVAWGPRLQLATGYQRRFDRVIRS